jgi:hypothetical protein
MSGAGSRGVIDTRAAVKMRSWAAAIRGLLMAVVVLVLTGVGTVVPAAAVGVEACANEQARSESSSKGLPDCRAYELVTPSEKSHNTGGVRRQYYLETTGPMESSPDGEAVSFVGEGFYQALNGTHSQMYLSKRGLGGWSTTNLQPSEMPALYIHFAVAAETGVIAAGQEVLGAGVPEGYASNALYLHTVGGGYTPLVTVKPPNREPGEFGFAYERESIAGRSTRFKQGLRFMGASADSSRVFFEANDALTPDALDGGKFANNLYEWSDGALHLMNVLPDGTTEPGAWFGSERGEVFANTAEYEGSTPNLSDAISADGSRVFWTDANNGNLYVREDGTSTVQVDAGVGGGGEFQTASTDGSKVFFTKGGDLYEYDLESGQTTDLAPGGQVQGIAGASSDGSYVYFVASAALAPGAGAGQNNLYLRLAGGTVFIAALGSNDTRLAAINEYAGGTEAAIGPWSDTFAGRAARVSSDGRYLAFASSVQLTSLPVPPGSVSVHTVEIYLYDSVSGQLSCVSCRQDGKVPVKPAWVPVAPVLGNFHQVRWLNSSGQVFFFSEEELVSEAPEGGLYEYKEGHIYLLAANHEEGGGPNVSFLDASENGNDVFFRTSSELVPEDQDELGDIYDARVNGRVPPPPPPPCFGEACQGEATPPFAPPALATSALGPSGNLTPAPTVAKPPAKAKPGKHSKAKRKKRRTRRRKRAGSRRPIGSRKGKGHR